MIYDGGSAPNTFGSVCTLAICKPGIRLHAQRGDWVLGFGSKTAYQKDKLIYCFKVEQKLTFDEYDAYCKDFSLKGKFNKSNGDCIYYLNTQNGKMERRHGYCHDTDEDQMRDLSGKYVLVSKQFEFYYFGRNAISIPSHLKVLIPTYRNYGFNKPTSKIDLFEKWKKK
eukprot:409293_1